MYVVEYNEYIFILEVIHMPRFDRTGPRGEGPGTGRGSGYCTFPLSFRNWRGGGLGRGVRRGLGRFVNQVPQTNIEKLESLKEYQEALEEEILDVKKELEELGKSE
jgi:hypothetical protein